MRVSNNYSSLSATSITSINSMIDEVVYSMIVEAVKHFESSRARNYEDDARFFFKDEELETFWKLFSGNPNKLVCKIILDDMGGFYCYEVSRVR